MFSEQLLPQQVPCPIPSVYALSSEKLVRITVQADSEGGPALASLVWYLGFSS